MIRILRNTGLAGEVVRRPERHDAQWYVAAVQPIYNLIERPIPTAGDHDVRAPIGRLRGQMGAVAGLPGDADVDGVPALPHPRDDVPQLGTIGARAVHDEGEMLASAHPTPDRGELTTPLIQRADPL
jgi:hypothetical protein